MGATQIDGLCVPRNRCHASTIGKEGRAWFRYGVGSAPSQSTRLFNHDGFMDRAAASATAAVLLGSAILTSPAYSGTAFAVDPITPEIVVNPTVEESWALLKKFYVDKSFHNQDWDAVRGSANLRAQKSGGFDAIDNMAKSLGDKYTRVVDSGAYEAMSRFDLIGAGVLFSQDDSGSMIVASPPMKSSSAFKAGMKQGDHVVSVNGHPTAGLTSFDILDLVVASDLPTITVTIGDGKEAAREVVLERSSAKISNPVEYRLLNGQGKTGYIRLSEFNARCKDTMKEAVLSLQSQGAERFVLDLRGNPGGTFQTATQVAGLFMSDCPVRAVSILFPRMLERRVLFPTPV